MNIEQIAKCNLFSSMTKSEIEDVIEKTHLNETIFQKGDILAMQDEPCNRLIILITGSVKGEMTGPSGKVIKVEDIIAPSPLAILFLFGKNNRFPVQATALEKVTALVIPKQSVLRMLQFNEQLLKNYLDISALYASKLTQKLYFMSFRTIKQKLAMYILNLAKDNTQFIELDRTQNALAEYFGVSRPSLARELHNMQKDNLISINRKEIEIKDRNRLMRLINFA